MCTYFRSQSCKAQQQQQDEVNVHSACPTLQGGRSYARTLPFAFARLPKTHEEKNAKSSRFFVSFKPDQLSDMKAFII